METKFLSLVLLTTILFAVLVSATVSFTVSPSSLLFTQTNNSWEFTVTNTGNETADFTIPSDIKMSDGTNEVAVTLDKYSFQLSNGSSETITASVNSDAFDSLELGVFSTTANIGAESTTSNETATQSVTLKAHKSYCENGPLGLNIIEIRDVDEDGSSSDNDWTWYPQDAITLSVDIKNNDRDNDHDVRVEWDLYDPDQDEFLDEGDEDTINIADGDSETLEFTFDVPYDLERGTYTLFVKAYDDDEGEEVTCSVAKDNGRSTLLGEEEGISIEIKRDSNDVEIVKTNMPELLTCGSTTGVDLWIANLGRNKEDKIKVTMLESVFGTETSREITKLDWDDKAEKITFPLVVPKDLKEGIYQLKFNIDFDYDKDDDDYNKHETVTYEIEVKGNCISEAVKAASLTAELDSDAIAGQQLVVKATVKNTGDGETTYMLSADDYSSWAELDRVEPKTATLDAGSSREFFIYLDVDEDAVGEQLFTINADFDGETTSREISVVIEESEGGTGGAVTGSTVSENLRDNWFIWVIVIINIILIIAI
ncbi:MAG: putative S-layer protein, partial [archaeon]